jgi:uncharacterized protein (TIGR02246 family)
MSTHAAPEIEAIEQVVATLEHAQQTELPDEFVGLFRPDAIWTTGGGKRVTGRGEISAFTHQVLPGAMKHSTQTYEVEHVLFIRPDVAVVKVRQRPVTLEGRPIEDQPEGSPDVHHGQGRRAMVPGRGTEHAHRRHLTARHAWPIAVSTSSTTRGGGMVAVTPLCGRGH